MKPKKGLAGFLLLLMAFAVCFGYLKYGPRNYVLSQNQYPEAAYWSDSDLFVTVRSGGFAYSELKGVKHIPVVGIFLSLFAGNQSVVIPAETTVYHYSGDAVQRDSIQGRSVTAVPSGANMYFVFSQSPNEKKVYRWDSLKLATVSGTPADEAIKRAEAQLNDEEGEEAAPKLAEGWHRSYLMMSAKSKPLSIPLHSFTATVRTETIAPDNRNRMLPVSQVTVEASTLSAPVQLIDLSKNGTTKINREEFQALFSRDPSPRSRANPIRSAYFMSEYLVLWLILMSPFLLSVFNLLRLKSKLLANLPEDASFPNALPEQFTALDKSRLEQLTGELEGLGFRKLLDYTMVSSMATQMAAFGRLMINESQNCYAEINQVFSRKKTVELASSFMTRFDGGWELSTGVRKPNGGNWILRLPRSLWVSKPGLDTNSLWQLHQQRCSEFRNDLGVSATPARGAEEYFRGVVQKMRARRESVKKKWVPVILFEFYSFAFHTRYEWKGEWPKLVAARNSFGATAAAQG